MIDPKEMGLKIYSVQSNGYGVVVYCPFHKDNNPSALFNSQDGSLKCFAGCGNKTVKEVQAKTGGDIKHVSQVSAITASLPHFLDYTQFPLAYKNDYLKSRLISDEQVERYGILDTGKSVLFPLKKSFDTIGILERFYDGRNQRYKVHGKMPPYFPYDELVELKENQKLIITEGVFGFLRCQLFGYNARAILGASRAKYVAAYFNSQKSVAVFDDDEAGLKASLAMFSANGIPFILNAGSVDEYSAPDFKKLQKKKIVKDWKEYITIKGQLNNEYD